MKVNVQYAETHLADLASAVDSGEMVEITRPEKPSLHLVISQPAVSSTPTGPRVLGAGRGEMRSPSAEEWQAMDKTLADLMNHGPLFPDQHQ